jgi:hypothetical protein
MRVSSKKREYPAHIEHAMPLTDASASVPPDVDAKTEDIGDTTPDPTVRVKDAGVMIRARDAVRSELSFWAVPTPQVRYIGSPLCYRPPLNSLCQRNSPSQVGLPFYPRLTFPFPYVNSHRYVIANDLSPSATAAMTRNVELNGLGGGTATDGSGPDPEGVPTERPGKVRVNQGDAR